MSSEAGKELIIALYEKGMVRTWFRHRPEGWKLISGLWSPFYIQLREISSFPELLRLAGASLGALIKSSMPDTARLVGIAFAGIPIAVAASLASGIPAAMTRKIEGVKTLEQLQAEIGRYGQHALVEGEFADGDRVVLVDDLVTRFDSKLIAAAQVEHEMRRRGLKDIVCHDVAVLVDREQGAAAAAGEKGFNLHALVPLKSKGLEWLREVMDPLEHEVITDYLEDAQRYQDEKLQQDLIARAKRA
ncbi:MAG TPA: hypothetical protein VMX35_02775 [Acidobacteriota bacterium]|nr:hypothetical protein [Acidobacteriota bacterium]